MTNNYEIYKAQLQSWATLEYPPAIHEEADELLCEIALSAANGLLTPDQTKELIDIYNSIEKWYE